jgi:hypothetical protein
MPELLDRGPQAMLERAGGAASDYSAQRLQSSRRRGIDEWTYSADLDHPKHAVDFG